VCKKVTFFQAINLFSRFNQLAFILLDKLNFRIMKRLLFALFLLFTTNSLVEATPVRKNLSMKTGWRFTDTYKGSATVPGVGTAFSITYEVYESGAGELYAYGNVNPGPVAWMYDGMVQATPHAIIVSPGVTIYWWGNATSGTFTLTSGSFPLS
jgi:hypothetical protein